MIAILLVSRDTPRNPGCLSGLGIASEPANTLLKYHAYGPVRPQVIMGAAFAAPSLEPIDSAVDGAPKLK